VTLPDLMFRKSLLSGGLGRVPESIDERMSNRANRSFEIITHDDLKRLASWR
jgi:hypothetical protein